MLLLAALVQATEARAAQHLSQVSWTALSTGDADVRGKPAEKGGQGARCARYTRPTCANVDIPCSDVAPVYLLKG